VLEIPASRCCLITHESEELRAAGFIDTVNCIFADEKTVVQKMQVLLDDPARLLAITDAGYELIHRHHTKRHRRMFIEWFTLWTSRQPGQRIVQTNALDPLRLISGDVSVRVEP
jgi:spore maturation protein CgeB